MSISRTNIPTYRLELRNFRIIGGSVRLKIKLIILLLESLTFQVHWHIHIYKLKTDIEYLIFSQPKYVYQNMCMVII